MSVKEQLRKIPRKGIGYGLLRYLNPIGAALGDASKISWPYGAPLSFNYLGQVDQALPDDAPLALASESTGQAHDPAGRRGFLIDIIASITHGQLRVEWLYSEKFHRKETIEALALQYQQKLLSLIKYLTSEDGVGSSIRLGYTPSDFPDADLRQDEIENLLEELMEGED